MPDLADIAGLSALRYYTQGDPRVKIAVLDGPVDLERSCFQGANLRRIESYWAENFEIESQYLQVFLEIEGSGKSEEEKKEMMELEIPDENIRGSLHLRFHANHIISTICGQPDSPVEGIAPNATVINIPIAYRGEDAVNPLNLCRAINTAIEQGVNIIHCAVCHPTQSGLAHEFVDKAIRQAQGHNILIVAPGGNDQGECWCVPAVLDDVLVVGAMKDTGEPFKFSNFGGKYTRQGILAPGENILGAQPGTDEPIRKQGTSCAAPIVTGVAALLMSLQLQRGSVPDGEAVRAALLNSAIPCDGDEIEEPERCLGGKINISGAYELLTGESLLAEKMTAEIDHDSLEFTGALIPAEVPVQVQEKREEVSENGGMVAGKSDSKFSSESVESVIEQAAVSVSAGSLNRTQITANNYITSSQRSPLVYALGTLGYDFGTEARRDTFKQWMPGVMVGNAQVPANPYDVRQMVDYLQGNLSESQSLIWTLNLDETPIYGIKPVGAFAADVYETMQYMLAGQVLPEGDEDYIERVSIPGVLTDERVRLFSGQVIPVIKVNSPRGMYGWNVNSLVESALQVMSREETEYDEVRLRRLLSSFLNRVYYEFRNLGQLARDRALNFAATNAFQAVQTFSEAIAFGMELDQIDVGKSPFCRYGSQCWDVKFKFFDPENSDRAKRVFRFTIDVSDRTPVSLGKVRSWAVSK